ncbi:MAG: hypothetical protein AB1461_06825 [Thermodesulfobacteriota bacterium]
MPATTTRDQTPAHLRALLRHFADLRDASHGGAVTRQDKEALFAAAVDLLDSYARQALAEINDTLLLGRGTVTASGLTRSPEGDAVATWSLGWPEQAQRHLQPVTLQAFFGRTFLHPHLRGATVGYWPLNVFTDADAAAELPTLRAIAGADLHNLVFQSDYRIIPVTVGR